MTPDSLKTHDPASIIIIRNTRKTLCGKTFLAADNPEGFTEQKAEPGLLWQIPPVAVPLKDLEHLCRTLKTASGLRDAAVIRGRLARDPNADEIKRGGIYRRMVNGGFANGIWEPAARLWVAHDLDGSKVPAEAANEPWAWLAENLPAPFAGTSFVWNLTSSHGMKSGLRARLWFLLSDPVEDSSLRRFVSTVPEWMKLDASLFTANHLHYVAAPAFEGVADPCAVSARWGIYESVCERVNAAPLMVLRGTDSDPSQVGFTLEGVPEPNTIELERECARLRSSVLKSGTARHDYGIAVGAALIALGMPPELILGEIEDNIRIRGREPAPGEAVGCLRHAIMKHKDGRLTTSSPSIASVLDRADAAVPAAAPGEPVAAPEVTGEAILSDAPPPALYGANDWLNAGIYRQEKYPTDGFLRWGEQDWEWAGAHWQKLENDEVLAHRIQNHTGMKVQRARSTTQSFRALMSRERLTPPCTMEGKPLPNLLAFRNGVLDLDQWLLDPGVALLPHSPERFLTCSFPYDYDPAAKCPAMRKFLFSVWPEQADQRRELQKMLGYLLMHDNRFHKMFIVLGSPRSGKGTILRLIRQLVGADNCCSPNLSSLSNDFGLDPLLGRSVAVIGEMNQQGKISDVAIDRMKSISGGDMIAVNRKNKGEAHLSLPVRFVIACNRLPGFLDPSGALAARLVIFTLWESFLGKEDTDLGRNLHAEIAGIAQWALAGLRMLLVEDGAFCAPASSQRVAEEYRATQAPSSAFLEECVAVGTARDWVANRDLYAVYQAWAKERGHQPTSASRLFIELGHKWPATAEKAKFRRVGPDGERERERSGYVFTEEGLAYLKAAGVFPA